MKRRSGFTLVELMVAMALMVFIMAILSEAFAEGVKTFRGLKSIGDMNERMRSTTMLLRKYLSASHFDGSKKLSDATFWDSGPPQEGFFRIYQGNPSAAEPPLLAGEPSCYRGTDHSLHFTARLSGADRSEHFLTHIPASSPLRVVGFPDARFQDLANTYSYPWAEVAFFLRTSGDKLPNGTDLYTLYFRQRLAVSNHDDVVAANGGNQLADTSPSHTLNVSCWPRGGASYGGNLYFNNPEDLTMPSRRFNTGSGGELLNGGNYPTLAEQDASLKGGDVLLTDVISFNVRVLTQGAADFVDLRDLDSYSGNNTNFPTTGTARVFDTWSQRLDTTDTNAANNYSTWATPGTAQSIPLYQDGSGNRIRIVAVQIILRVWDPKTEMARQVTLIQDL